MAEGAAWSSTVMPITVWYVNIFTDAYYLLDEVYFLILASLYASFKKVVIVTIIVNKSIFFVCLMTCFSISIK